MKALAIASSVNHWQLYIRESGQVTQVLTDSRPCVQATKKLIRGEFSASARVSTFLSTMSRFFNRINLQHVSGTSAKLLPADYLSRHPAECESQNCQICSFARECSDSVIQHISVSDVLERNCGVPFSNKSAWLECQQDCKELRCVRAHLSQGTQPSRKASRVKDVKAYLRVCTIANQPPGLIIRSKIVPFSSPLELIVIPRALAHGLITALHLRLKGCNPAKMRSFFVNLYFLGRAQGYSYT